MEFLIFFFRITQYNVDTHICIHTHPLNLYPYEHLRRTEPVNFEIHEVNIGVSLLTGTSAPLKIAPLNSKINQEKYEHPYQVKNLDPGERLHQKESNQFADVYF
jgi:hypothetical protein